MKSGKTGLEDSFRTAMAATIGRINAYSDPDGAPLIDGVGDFDLFSLDGVFANISDGDNPRLLEALRAECNRLFNRNPFIKTAVSDLTGVLVGDGFRMYSDNQKVSTAVDSITKDVRNDLYINIRKYVTERSINGELFLCLSCESAEQFVHTDFVHPDMIAGCGQKGCGIIFHPSKTRFPLVYEVQQRSGESLQIPSINIAHNPSILKDVEKKYSNYLAEMGYDKKKLEMSKAPGEKFKNVGGYGRFIVEWDGERVADRTVSYLLSVIIWANLYILLKSIEIDHKRACANYAWVIETESEEAWSLWMQMSKEDQDMTGLLGPKEPGCTMVAPPGFKVSLKSNQLPQIKESDSDILELITSGLNIPSDVLTGTSSGKNFGSVKASRGPWSDRIVDAQHVFKTFLRDRYWRSVFVLLTKVYGFPSAFSVEEPVDFKDGEAVWKAVKREPYELVSFSMPVFSAGELSELRSLYLGVKSGSLDDALGVSRALIARKLGISDYKGELLRHALEEKKYPKPTKLGASDYESAQEKELEKPSRENQEANSNDLEGDGR